MIQYFNLNKCNSLNKYELTFPPTKANMRSWPSFCSALNAFCKGSSHIGLTKSKLLWHWLLMLLVLIVARAIKKLILRQGVKLWCWPTQAACTVFLFICEQWRVVTGLNQNEKAWKRKTEWSLLSHTVHYILGASALLLSKKIMLLNVFNSARYKNHSRGTWQELFCSSFYNSKGTFIQQSHPTTGLMICLYKFSPYVILRNTRKGEHVLCHASLKACIHLCILTGKC